MKNFGWVRKVASAFVLLALMVSLGATPVMAEEAPDYRLQVSPVSLDIELKPGQTIEKTFQVQNTGRKPFEFKIETTPYSVINEEYDGNYTDSSDYNQITKWVTYSIEEGTARPGDSIPVTATIDVPSDVPAGGQYALIAVTMIEDKEEGGDSEALITATSRAGIILYSSIDGGNTRKEGKVIENKVPSFRFQPPIVATSTVENTGNVHATATYTLQVFPLFGGEEVYSNEDNPETRTILPETKRYNEIAWEGAPALGIFKVKQTVNFLGKDDVTEKVVFLCPIWFLFIILLLIFVVVFWIINRVRGRRLN